jgi:peptide deformylase
MDEVSKKEFEHLEKSHRKLVEAADLLTQIVRDLIQTMREEKGLGPVTVEARLHGCSERITQTFNKIGESKR